MELGPSSSQFLLEISTSFGATRFGTAAISSSSSNSVGKSLKLCTAKSISSSSNALSSSLVKRPFASMLYNWELVILSPFVLIMLTSIFSLVIAAKSLCKC